MVSVGSLPYATLVLDNPAFSVNTRSLVACCPTFLWYCYSVGFPTASLGLAVSGHVAGLSTEPRIICALPHPNPHSDVKTQCVVRALILLRSS